MKNKLNSFSLYILSSAKQITDHPDILKKMQMMNVRLIEIGMETIDKESMDFLNINAKIPDPKLFVKTLQNGGYKNEIVVFQILNTGFEKTVDEIKKKAFDFYKLVKPIKTLKILPYLIQPFPGIDLIPIWEKKGIAIQDLKTFNSILGHVNLQSKWVTPKELEKFFSEYTHFLIFHNKSVNLHHGLFYKFIYFSTSSLLFTTKLKIMFDMGKMYLSGKSNLSDVYNKYFANSHKRV